MINTLDIAWLGGLLEGEGSFMMGKSNDPRIQMQMTDRDTMERAASILGVPVSSYVRKPKGKASYLPVYGLGVTGHRSIAWMMTLYKFLGNRRQAKIREILEKWKTTRIVIRGRMATCHPDRKHCADGLCRMCWMREYRKRTGKNGTYYRNRSAA